MNENAHAQNHDSNSQDHPKDHQNHENNHQDHDHADHHAHMVADFKRRFFVSLILGIPIVLLSPMIQQFMKERQGRCQTR